MHTMAGIGEASAIVGTATVGLSLAKTLYACASEYRNARDDIISLATDVEVTIIQAQELAQLVSTNDTSKLLNDRGLKLAKQSCTDCNLIVPKLLKLLGKAGVPESQTQTIRPEDIDVSKFHRAAWILLKPEVLVVKRELDSIKLRMLVARSCIEWQSAASPADRDAAYHRIGGLERSADIARRLLRKARMENQRAAVPHAERTDTPPHAVASTSHA